MLKLAIDRYEGDIAVLTTDDGRQIEIPHDLLPSGCKPGDLLTFAIDRDEAGTANLKSETKAVQRRLRKTDTGGDIKL